MITNIPTPDEFETAGLDFLNIAWSFTCALMFNLDDAEVETWDDDGEVKIEYWELAQKTLTKSLALTHQGIELMIKAKIIETSPFLIMAGKPNEWPRKCSTQNTPFSFFKTIDAQEIIKVYNTISSSRLSDEFINQYENLRKLRNRIMHSVDKNIKVHAKDVIIAILETSEILLKPIGWIEARTDYLENEPEVLLDHHDSVVDNVYREIDKVIEMLQPAEAKKYFRFNKKQRRYLCLDCNDSYEFASPDLAQLLPNTPSSVNTYCILCSKTKKVMRKKCKDKNCKSNVIDVEKNRCLICGEEQK